MTSSYKDEVIITTFLLFLQMFQVILSLKLTQTLHFVQK